MPQRNLRRQIFKRSQGQSNFIFIIKLIGLGFFLFVFLLGIVFIFFAKDLPRPEKFTEKQFIQSTKIYDRTGEILLYEVFNEEKRTIVPLSEIPEYLKQAVLSTEDANFYKHFGIDFSGILRSILINLKLKEPLYGGSTIPQQLIRSTFLTSEKSIERKIREIVLALELNRRYSKDQILEWYLNQVPFGLNSYGVEAASKTYFHKSASQLSLPESALLAALIRAPSHYSPYGPNKTELLERKNYVLKRMKSNGFLNEEELEKLKQQEIVFVEKPLQIQAPYFTLWIKQQLEEKYGEDFLEKRGLKVYTTLDWEIQKIAEKITKEGIEQNKVFNAHNAGLTAINPKTGEVLAMTVGNGDYFSKPYPENCTSGSDCLFDPQFNVVLGTKSSPGRQPGSAFKPFVYATAFQKGYTDTTIVLDEPTCFGYWGGEEYCPQNYDGLFRGPVSLRSALAQSLNVPAVKVLSSFAGLDDSIKTAKTLGITTLNQPSSFYGLSIVLGGGEVKLIDMVSAYGVFATEGLMVPFFGILKIEDSSGNIIEENHKAATRVLDQQTARMINDILSDNDARAPIFGYNSPLYFENYQVAVKTGTTQNFRDGWAIGYTPSIAAGVWMGNNNNEPMEQRPAAISAGVLFHNFMEKVLPDYPKEEFNKPDTPTTN